MIFKRKHIYFVSFWNVEQSKNGFGIGNTEFTLDHKIKNIEDIRAMENFLNKDSETKHTIINYQLLK